ncbi:lipid asymmetry maintenance protein MlaB [Pontibacterium sp.]
MADWSVERAGKNEVRLTGKLQFADIMSVRERLDQLLEEMKGDVVVDFSGVTRVDSSALSLWMCGLRRAETLNITLKPVNVPDEMQSIAGLVGLSQCLS